MNSGVNVQVEFSMAGGRGEAFALEKLESSLLSRAIKVHWQQREALVLTSLTSPTNEEAASYFFVCSPGVKQSCTSGLEIENSLCCRLTA